MRIKRDNIEIINSILYKTFGDQEEKKRISVRLGCPVKDVELAILRQLKEIRNTPDK